MPIWPVPPASVEPEVTLENWRIFKTNSEGRHFVGYDVRAREGRVSSAIVELNVDKRFGRTSSGRLYRLSGPPGYDAEAEHVWNLWAEVNHVTHFDDVTDTLFKS